MGFRTEDLFTFDGIDFDYEFDAPKFYDFTRPESDSDVQQAELWFASAPGYPSSPLAWDNNNHLEDPSSSFIQKADENRIDVGAESNTCSSQEVAKGKLKSAVKFKNPSFMKPTASHLAKKNYPIRVQCDRLVRRKERMNPLSSSMLVNQAIKRQKLENGYLTKGGYQKQQAVLLHKTPEKVQRSEVNSTPPRPKLTIPRGPSLQTANRAHINRSRIAKKTAENSKLKNRKAFQSRIANSKSCRVSSVTTREGKPEPLETFTACCLTEEELNSPTADRSPHDPVIDSLNKLCLASEANHNPKLRQSHSIGSKKAVKSPAPLLVNHEKTEVVAKSPRLGGRRHQCANDWRLPSIGAIFNMNRSFDIH